jgi:membrane protein
MKKIFINSIRSFQSHGAPRFSAAIAYYMIFCLAPLFVFALSILHIFLADASLNNAFFTALQQLFGRDAMMFLQENLQTSSEPSLWLTLVGLIFGLIGASAVFKELKCGLDTIFETPLPKKNFLEIMLRNIATFGTLIVIGLFLLVSLLSTMIISILGTYFQNSIEVNTGLFEILNFGFSFCVLTTFFMILYTFVPDTKIPFRLTLFGSLATAFLFTLGKTLFGLYLGTIGVSSGYGAAGSILVLLVWIFYSAQIFFFGAEITAQIRKNKALLKKIL